MGLTTAAPTPESDAPWSKEAMAANLARARHEQLADTPTVTPPSPRKPISVTYADRTPTSDRRRKTPNRDEQHAQTTKLTFEVGDTTYTAGISTGPGFVSHEFDDENPAGKQRNQDCAFVDHSPLDQNLNTESAAQTLHQLFIQANTHVTDKMFRADTDTQEFSTGFDKESGTTAAVCITTTAGIIAASVGDCQINLLTAGANGYQNTRLSCHHRAENPHEAERIAAIPAKEKNQLQISSPTGRYNDEVRRLCVNSRDAEKNMGIANCRGFGAKNYAPAFSAEPSITFFPWDEVPDKAYLFLTTDGYSDVMPDHVVTKFLNDNPEMPLSEIASQLRQKAYFAMTPDNITTALLPVKPGMVAGIFDGFGTYGKVAAESAREFFQTHIHQQLQQQQAKLAKINHLLSNFDQAVQTIQMQGLTSNTPPATQTLLPQTQHLIALLQQLRKKIVDGIMQEESNAVDINEKHPAIGIANNTCTMLNNVSKSQCSHQEKIATVSQFLQDNAHQPFCKKYACVLSVIACAVIGLIAGAVTGALLTPTFFGIGGIPGAIAGAIEGATMGAGGTGFFCSAGAGASELHKRRWKPVNTCAAEAIEAVVDSPRLGKP